MHRHANRDRLEITLGGSASDDTDLALQYLFTRDGVYEQLADKLLDTTRTTRRWRAQHWLCEGLNDCADGCAAGMYINLARDQVAAVLHSRMGAPQGLANALAAGLAFGAPTAPITGPPNLALGLRALIVLVCPNLERCPPEAAVVKAFRGPNVTRGLRSAVESSTV